MRPTPLTYKWEQKMALVTNVTKVVEIPNEKETAIIRKLSHTQLKQAAKARQSEGVGFMKEMGGELLKALREADTDKIKKIQDAQEADASNYDRDTLLRFGVVSWTYPVAPIVDTPHVNVAINENKASIILSPNGLDQLDEPTAKFLADEIFEFSRPENKAEAKNV